ncbi:hypothetical protein Mgra_00009753 [Meloidogyne graminicola]|uniref:Uncharacterized protein n=1 Tax=Meloidogyne graminicola TaxID=189291 RepID=A0A8S9ZCY6_9BILA|nr:hypothetical protein Mgra_00009753 [Meloidogyne graminicola]
MKGIFPVVKEDLFPQQNV